MISVEQFGAKLVDCDIRYSCGCASGQCNI